MNKEELKPLIKLILKEFYSRQLNEWSSGIYDDFDITLDNLIVPGLIDDTTNNVEASINIQYESNPGAPARGMFGPPEHSSPAESAEVNIIDWDINKLTIYDANNQPHEFDDFDKLPPQDFAIIKKSVSDYIESNKDDIESKILDTLSDDESSEDSGEDDYFDDR